MEKLDDIKKALMALSDSIYEYDMAYWCAGLRREAIEEIESLSTIDEAIAMLKGMKETLEALLEALLEEEEDTEERARLHFLMEMVEEMENSLQGLSSASKSLLKNLFRIAR